MDIEKNEVSTPINSPEKTESWKELAKEIAKFALIAVCVVLPFRIYIAEPYLVDGRSMDPTFATGNYLIVDKLSYEVGAPKRNSVIVFKYPNDPSKSFIKRIIGLPGETVVMKDGNVRIVNTENPQGFDLDSLYVTHKCPVEIQNCITNIEKTLSSDEYFVLGDNRAESFDSRYWGPLNKKFLQGRPVLRLWPINKIGIFPGDDVKNNLTQ
ncbi:MAG: signal peptidase I [Nitrospira sp.]